MTSPVRYPLRPLQQIVNPNANIFPTPPGTEHDPLTTEDVAKRLLYVSDLKRVRRDPHNEFFADPALLIAAELQSKQVRLRAHL